MANDPSAYVPPQVLPHIHLVSSQRYPTLQQLAPENALEFLLQAPRLVKDAAPMSWQYFQQPPGDGTVFLTWQPPSRQTKFSSDGYLWVDPEATFHTNVRGYTLEILIHHAGIRYQIEPMCMHRRYRFRIINKNPAAMGNFDPSLWIVHYSMSEPQHRYPANQISIIPEMQKMFADRQLIEKQGQLVKKDFMLYDKLNWPKVEFAHTAQLAQGRPMFAGTPQQMAAMSRHPPYMQHQAPGIGPSPAKRARQAGPVPPGGPSATVPPGIDIADEEDSSFGDYLDHLTAHEISLMRYTQHHNWMEMVYSPYATEQILPIDLGLGLMGELAPLTEGLFEAPNPQPGQNPTQIPAAKILKKLEPAQYDEFKKRVLAYQKKTEDEIEVMKAEHAKKLADFSRTRTYVQAERKLRDAEWDSRSDQAADGTQESPSNRSSTPESRKKVAQIVSDVEKTLKVKIGPSKQIITVDKGGLSESQPPQVNGHNDNATQQNNHNFQENGSLNGLLDEAALDADNTAASLLDQFTQNSLGNTPGATISAAALSQPGSLPHSNAATPGANTSGEALQTTTAQISETKPSEPSADTAPMPQGDTMDLDVDLGEGLDAPLNDKPAESDWVMVDQASENKDSGQQQQQQQQQQQPAQSTGDVATTSQAPAQENTPATAETSGNTAQPANDTPAAETGETPGMFDASEFDSFDNLDTAGDALADAYGGDDLGLDLDHSAFGDAFQASETHQDGLDGNNE